MAENFYLLFNSYKCQKGNTANNRKFEYFPEKILLALASQKSIDFENINLK